VCAIGRRGQGPLNAFLGLAQGSCQTILEKLVDFLQVDAEISLSGEGKLGIALEGA
jgi:hypothetical protein